MKAAEDKPTPCSGNSLGARTFFVPPGGGGTEGPRGVFPRTNLACPCSAYSSAWGAYTRSPACGMAAPLKRGPKTACFRVLNMAPAPLRKRCFRRKAVAWPPHSKRRARRTLIHAQLVAAYRRRRCLETRVLSVFRHCEEDAVQRGSLVFACGHGCRRLPRFAVQKVGGSDRPAFSFLECGGRAQRRHRFGWLDAGYQPKRRRCRRTPKMETMRRWGGVRQ